MMTGPGYVTVGPDNKLPAAVQGELNATFASHDEVGYSGAKAGAFSFGGSGGGASVTSIVDLISRSPFRLPIAPTRARLRIKNQNLKDNLGLTPGAFDFTGVWIGKPVVNAAGEPTPDFTAVPTNVVPAFSTPVDGTEYISPWFNTEGLITAGDDHLLSYGYTCATGQTTHRATGFHWWSNLDGQANNAGDQAMVSSVTTNKNPHFDMWLEYEFAGAVPVNLYIGDSLTDGFYAKYGTRDSYPQLSSRRTEAVAVVNAYTGSTLSPGWDNIAGPKWDKYAGLQFDAAYVHLGTNDIYGGADLPSLQARLGTVLGNLRTTYGDMPVYLGIVPPRNFTAAPEAVRVSYNTWLRTLPYGAAGSMDFDRAVRDPANLVLIDGDFDGGDGTHMNTAGYDKMAQAVPVQVPVS